VDTVNPTQQPTTSTNTVPDTTSAVPDFDDTAGLERLPVTMTPAEVLRAAALYIERHGWIQHLFYGHNGPFPPADVLGAIRIAVLGDTQGLSGIPSDPDTILINRVQRYLAAQLDTDYTTGDVAALDVIGDWNDETDRTPDTVIATLREAADDWDRIHTTKSTATAGGEPR
jgi:hypothetical protein